MKLSPLDLRKQQFGRALRGYDRAEVKAFLELVARQLEEAHDEVRLAEERVREMEHKLKHYERVELALQEALETARETGRRAEASADQKARLIVEEAELKALRVLQDAEQERYHLRQDVVKLTHRQNEVAARMRAFLMSELEILAQFQGDDPVGFIKLVPAGEQPAGELPPAPRRALAEAPPPAAPAAPEEPVAAAPEPPAAEETSPEQAPEPAGASSAEAAAAEEPPAAEPAPAPEGPPAPEATAGEAAPAEPEAPAEAAPAEGPPAESAPAETGARFDIAAWFRRYASEEERAAAGEAEESAAESAPEPEPEPEPASEAAPEPAPVSYQAEDEAPPEEPPSGPRPLHEVLADAKRGTAAPSWPSPGGPAVWERYSAVPDEPAEGGSAPPTPDPGAPAPTRAPDPFASPIFHSPFFREAAPPPEPGPAPGSDAAQGWSLRSIVTGEPEPEAPPVASDDERERIRRLLEDLD